MCGLESFAMNASTAVPATFASLSFLKTVLSKQRGLKGLVTGLPLP